MHVIYISLDHDAHAGRLDLAGAATIHPRFDRSELE